MDKKCCATCNQTKDLIFFEKTNSNKDGYRKHCIKCINNKRRESRRLKQREYRKKNQDKIKLSRKLYHIKRRVFSDLLSSDIDKNFLEEIYKNECPTHHLDHFIPISWGCLGNSKNNLIVLKPKINLMKNRKNPFLFLKFLEGEEYSYFLSKINYIAKINNMTYNELEDFVNWCENNKRSLEDLKKDNTDMMELYKKEMCLIEIRN